MSPGRTEAPVAPPPRTYVVRRPGIAADTHELSTALVRLRSFEESTSTLPARWLLSCALREADGRLGLACVFQADDARTLRRHAALTRLPAVEILPVAATLVVRALAPSRVYLVRRRGFWKTDAELAHSAAQARRVGDHEMPTRVCWLRSYAVREADGTLGTWCLYQSVDAQALMEHAARAGIPADEITPVLGCHVFRDDAPDLARPAATPPP
jgi:hypothetical protein